MKPKLNNPLDIGFNPKLPIVHSINSYILEKEGWKRNGSTYTKEGKEIKYDGVHFKYNGQVIEFLDDIKQNNPDNLMSG